LLLVLLPADIKQSTTKNADNCIAKQAWPVYNEQLCKNDMVRYPIQVNGKVRDNIDIDEAEDEDETKLRDRLTEAALRSERVAQFLKDKQVKKMIFVKGKILNIVTDK
jgi:leucyl-tRNA synthetase